MAGYDALKAADEIVFFVYLNSDMRSHPAAGLMLQHLHRLVVDRSR